MSTDQPTPLPHHDVYDLTIIGGGPTGLFAAFYAGLREMKVKIVDSLEQLGGQLATLYPEKYVYDVAGFPKVLARDLAQNLIDQAMQYDPAVFLGETVKTLEPLPDGAGYVVTSDKNKHYTKALIIAAGAGAFQPKKLPLPDASQYEGSGVYYAVKTKSVFAGKRVLVIGGGDSALDWATNLHGTARHVTIIHRRNQFRAHEDSITRALNAGVKILTFWEIKSIEATDGVIRGAVILNNQTKEEKHLEVDAILAQLGFNTNLGAIKDWPLTIEKGSIRVDAHMQAGLPGVFSAGDVCGYEGKLKLIATGFGEACTAVNYAKAFLDPKAKAFPGHSSEMGPQMVATVTVDSH